MLCLTRRKNEAIIIGDDITVTVVQIEPGRVRIGIEAPKDVPINRKEIWDIIQREKAESAGRCANSHCGEQATAGGTLCADCQHEADGITF